MTNKKQMKHRLANLYELIVLLQATGSAYLLGISDDQLVKVFAGLSLVVVIKSLIQNYIKK